MPDSNARAPFATQSARVRTVAFAVRARQLALAAASALLGSACASDPEASTEPVLAEVFWMRADERVGTIDHSLVSTSLPEDQYRRQAPAAVETRKASRKTLPDWRMADLLAELEGLDFEEYAGDRIDPAALDAVGIVRGGKVRVVSITPLRQDAKNLTSSEIAHRKRLREIFYLVTQVDNATMGFQTQSDLRPNDFEDQREIIRRAAEEAAKKKHAGGGP